jgi:hypothetical protein
MKQTTLRCEAVCALASALMGSAVTMAQVRTDDNLREEIDALRKRMETLEERHEDDQARLRDLESQLRARQGAGGDEVDRARAEESRRLADEVLAGVDARADAAGAAGQGNLFNPQITAFVDFGFSLSSSDDPEFDRFNLRETEVDLRAAVTPWADGVLILAFPEEAEMNAMGGTDFSIEFEIEEAYLDVHTLAEGLALKGGKFRNAFGMSNPLHTHDLPQVDRPLAMVAFFGEEGLASIGASASWIVPNPWNKYVELVAEVFDAKGGEEGAPVLGGPEPSDPAYLARLTYFDDLGAYGSVQLGGTYLYSQGADTGASDLSTFGVDATLKWLDPQAPDHRSLLVQSEMLWNTGDVAGAPSFDHEAFGAYVFGQYQFAQSWYAGVRFDSTEFPDVAVRPAGDRDWALSPYLTWYVTEFLRLRIEYQHLESMQSGAWSSDENVLFAVTFAIGAHPAHPYWVNR